MNEKKLPNYVIDQMNVGCLKAVCELSEIVLDLTVYGKIDSNVYRDVSHAETLLHHALREIAKHREEM